MAYNNYYPVTYQPNYFGQTPYQMQQPQPQQQTQTQQNGFVRVQSENDARMYPVAPGNSVIFIDENLPYCYTKTMDFSQLDRPKFEKYRLVKEEDASESAQNAPTGLGDLSELNNIYAQKSDLEAIWDELDALNDKLKTAERKAVKAKRQGVGDDE